MYTFDMSVLYCNAPYLQMVLVSVLDLLHRSPRRVLVADALMLLLLLMFVVVGTLVAAVALPPHSAAVAHAPVLVSVRWRRRVQPGIKEKYG